MFAGTAADIKAIPKPIINPPSITSIVKLIMSSIIPPLITSIDGISNAVINNPEMTAVKQIEIASRITEVKIVKSLKPRHLRTPISLVLSLIDWAKVLEETKGKEFSYLKERLSEVLIETICPVGKKLKELTSDKTYLEEVLKKGREKALKKAEENLKKIREIVGLL